MDHLLPDGLEIGGVHEGKCLNLKEYTEAALMEELKKSVLI